MNDLHQQYLKEMGIDVWRLRANLPGLAQGLPSKSSGSEAKIAATLAVVGAVVGDDATTRRPSARRVVPVTTAAAISPQGEEQPNFLFCFLDYENLSLMVSLDVNVAELPADVRQFADDVDFAVNPGQRRIPRVRDLRWPMVKASHIKQNEADARQVVHQKMVQCGQRLVIFGPRAARYITDSDGNPVSLAGQQLLIVADVQHYFSVPADKRDLWQQLRELRQISDKAND